VNVSELAGLLVSVNEIVPAGVETAAPVLVSCTVIVKLAVPPIAAAPVRGGRRCPGVHLNSSLCTRDAARHRIRDRNRLCAWTVQSRRKRARIVVTCKEGVLRRQCRCAIRTCELDRARVASRSVSLAIFSRDGKCACRASEESGWENLR
jgi:hypothetical protein